MEKIDNNPFSFESYLLRDAQRIVAEICERREHKISNSAVMNVQRSYLLFKDINKNILPKAPLNSTPEEETLYNDLFQSLVNYRNQMRVPLISYSSSKIQTINEHIKTKKSNSELKKDLNVIDNASKVNIDVNINDDISNRKSRVNKNNYGKKVVKTNDMIPPDVEAEIYREFGKEPNSKHYKGLGKEPKDFKEKISTEVVMILDELPSIMGVDHKVYGPFYPGDVITMPEPNARILIKNQKGKSIQRYK